MLADDYIKIFLMKFLKNESGASLIEYTLIASLIAVVCGLFFLALNKDI